MSELIVRLMYLCEQEEIDKDRETWKDVGTAFVNECLDNMIKVFNPNTECITFGRKMNDVWMICQIPNVEWLVWMRYGKTTFTVSGHAVPDWERMPDIKEFVEKIEIEEYKIVKKKSVWVN